AGVVKRRGLSDVLATEPLVVVQHPVVLRDRFRLSVHHAEEGEDEAENVALPARPPSSDSALYSFFGFDNLELLVKVLDACAINGHHWVFLAAATDLAFQVEVEDLHLGNRWSYSNAAGSPAPAVTETLALPCE
ncbi:MAG: hypothetical protein MI919_35805, partial [Holophagales bacterium]|nr:hypothetical protein [Holophagales bacterium]